MDISSCIAGVIFGTVLFAAAMRPPASDLYEVDVRALADAWEKEHVSPADPSTLKHAELKTRLHALALQFPSLTQVEPAGRSAEDREIYLLKLGSGPRRILMWSQMHGDESTATSALVDLAHFLCSHRQEPWVSEILEKFTLLCVPMLNPDGAEQVRRRNAQGIDINRDARALQTPEGRLLRSLRDRFDPFLGFNLHNQNSLTTVGNTGQVATIALLAVAADPSPCLPEGTHSVPASVPCLTRQVVAVLFEALSPFVYGHISRYDEDFNPRAFGDNLTLWGTPVVLIESGGNPAGRPANFGVKLNFVGLLAVLNSLSTGRIQNANPAVFDSLKMNSETPIYDLLLRNAWICTGTGVPLFKGDIAIRHGLRGETDSHSVIADIGDLGVFNAHEVIDCSGMMVSPGLIGWDEAVQLLDSRPTDRDYLKRGYSTLMETGAWQQLERRRPEVDRWRTDAREVNWGYVITGGPSKPGAEQRLRLAEWLAAGARGWIVAQTAKETPGEEERIPQWFGIQTMEKGSAERFRIPPRLTGNPASVLPRWTSEAATQFGLQRRGIITVGAIPDLVLWNVPSNDEAPAELGDCKPSRVIIDGRLIDPNHPVRAGQFLGR